MNQHDQMLRDALREVLAYCDELKVKLGSVRILAQQALATESAPLVRLTDGEIDKLDCVEIEYGFYGEYWISSKSVKDFANAIMDAMERVNK